MTCDLGPQDFPAVGHQRGCIAGPRPPACVPSHAVGPRSWGANTAADSGNANAISTECLLGAGRGAGFSAHSTSSDH